MIQKYVRELGTMAPVCKDKDQSKLLACCNCYYDRYEQCHHRLNKSNVCGTC